MNDLLWFHRLLVVDMSICSYNFSPVFGGLLEDGVQV